MAPVVFALPDIANVIAAFPPQKATDSSTLFRSLSDNRLIHSEVAEERFEDLLNRSQERISLNDLPKILDIDAADGFAERPNLWHWRPEQTIVPRPEADRLIHELSDAVKSSFVAIRPWAAQRKVSRHDLTDVQIKQGSWIALNDAGQNTSLITSIEHYEQLKAVIGVHINEARATATEIDLFTMLSPGKQHSVDQVYVTPGILYDLAQDVLNTLNESEGNTVGSLTRHDNTIKFAPREREERRRMREQSELVARVDRALKQLNEEGYVILSKTQYNVDKDAIASRIPSGTTYIETREGSAFITEPTQARLSDRFEKLTAEYVKTERSQLPKQPGKAALDQELLDWLVNRSEVEPSLARICLNGSACSTKVVAALANQKERLEQEDCLAFSLDFTETLTAPVRLYADGVAFVQDEQLRQRLDDAAAELVCKDVIKRTIEEWRKSDVLWHKERKRQIEKLYDSLDKAPTTSSMRASIAKAARKLGIEEPASTTIQEKRSKTLQQNLQAMKKMQRGSDVLQNAIWILLSQSVANSYGVHALFVSSGKDTSRMIKLYRSHGDASVVRLLEQWRDELKKGADGEAVRGEMISAAAEALQFPDGFAADAALIAAS